MSIVSIGESEIFPFWKWERILDLIIVPQFTLVPSPTTSGVGTTPLGVTSTSILLLGIQV
jgi:hypothetical protein